MSSQQGTNIEKSSLSTASCTESIQPQELTYEELIQGEQLSKKHMKFETSPIPNQEELPKSPLMPTSFPEIFKY